MKEDEFCGVYRAERRTSAGFVRPVLLTVLHPQHCGDTDAARAFAGIARVFGRAASSRVAPVEDAGVCEGRLYRVSTPPRGRRLDALLEWLAERRTRLPSRVAAKLAVEVAWAMDALFDSLDDAEVPRESVRLQKQSIRIERGGAVRLYPPILTASGDLVETRYDAPEVSSGGESTCRAGVFAASCLTWELFTLKSGPPPQDDTPSFGVDGPMLHLLRRGVHNDPAQRFASLAHFAEQLLQQQRDSASESGPALDYFLDSLAPDSCDRRTGVDLESDATTQLALAVTVDEKALKFANVTAEALRLEEIASCRRRNSSETLLPGLPTTPRLELTGSDPARALPLTYGERWVIGRGHDVDLVIDDPDASREHFEIARVSDGKYAVFDLGSKNGLLVNGAPVDAHDLSSGDEIVAGRSRFRFLE